MEGRKDFLTGYLQSLFEREMVFDLTDEQDFSW